jgi:hypothetical protein
MPRRRKVALVSRDIDHPWREGCCDVDEQRHRHMTSEEYDAAYPTVFDQRARTEAGQWYSVEAREYGDPAASDIGVTITMLFLDDSGQPDESGVGLCFDIDLNGLRAVMPLLTDLIQQTRER